MLKKNKKGLTLLEVLAVIVIISILFTVLIPSVNSSFNKAKIAGAQTDIKTYETALDVFLTKTKKDEYTEEDINELLDKEYKFQNGVSVKESPWKTPYNLEIKEGEIKITTEDRNEIPIVYGVKFVEEEGEFNSQGIGFE